MPTWPTTLPQSALGEGYAEKWDNIKIETPMEAGALKQRRRYTAKHNVFDISFILTSAQVIDLDTFYYTTLEGGTVKFTWKHPRTGISSDFRFFGDPPTVEYKSAKKYAVSFKMAQA